MAIPQTQSPFARWLDAQMYARRLTLPALARLLVDRAPGMTYERVYNTCYGWLHQWKLPSEAYRRALGAALQLPDDQLSYQVNDAKVLRHVERPITRPDTRPMPQPRRPRRVPTYETPEELAAQAQIENIDFLLRIIDRHEEVRPLLVKLKAEARGQSAQRVVPAESVPAPQDEAIEREEARR